MYIVLVGRGDPHLFDCDHPKAPSRRSASAL